ncbi:hypothetical protein DES53_102389 [Roseimicrobium gellanilyticum]|uniref:Uncharacterized protein n=1 Tax=Roseimicrobium gellanilyticum TaxID=748857 RepID=A0A366HSU9_9BACT|nr:hypothetical protein DES53_102389 [Roseimicrobium gellanilyticum]
MASTDVAGQVVILIQSAGDPADCFLLVNGCFLSHHHGVARTKILLAQFLQALVRRMQVAYDLH